MSGKKFIFDIHWNVDKYKSNYDPEHWDLCRVFMETHKTKYSEQRVASLTEAFYQMGVYGSSYDPKTTRLINALTVEVLDGILKVHPEALHHPFNKSTGVVPKLTTADKSQPSKEEKETSERSIWDIQVDQNIIANVLIEAQLRELFKGFIIIYDIRATSTMNDNKVSILEESFKRSKFGPCHWAKDDTHNNICPIRMALKWRHVMLAEAVGCDEKSLKTRLAQAVLSKLANLSSGIEAKWSYYRDGRLPDKFDNPNPTRSNIYRVMPRSQFRAMAEVTSFIDTFANSDSFAETIFGLDFSTQEKKQIMEHINKNWCTKLTYRTLSKMGVKNKTESHVCVYHIRTGEELRRWLEQSGGENERYRLVPPGKHRRAGPCDNNVREVLTTDAVEMPKEGSTTTNRPKEDSVTVTSSTDRSEKRKEEAVKRTDSPNKKTEDTKKSVEKSQNKKEEKDNDLGKKDKHTVVEARRSEEKSKDTEKKAVDKGNEKILEESKDELEKLLDGFVLFYDANKTSEINKDDWFTALCESFKLSKFGPLEVVSENIRPLRTKCVFKWKDQTLASAEGLTETQAKTAATLQLISKLEPFTYIIQAKEEYFNGGKVPPFVEDPKNRSDFCRVVCREDLPSYYTIFQTIDEFARSHSYGELVFGPDFTWDLKNEIVVYLKAKGLDHRYFTMNDQQPSTHMAIYHTVRPEALKEFLLKNGGENEKYKLIPPQKSELNFVKTTEANATKEAEKPLAPSTTPAQKVALATTPAKKVTPPAPPKKTTLRLPDKRKQPEDESALPSLLEEIESNKIQIKLKKFKVDKVDYPEDTGGDFPGLILWIGIRKNSVWQRNLFNILLDSFKMSKYGELLVEESEENVWTRRQPLKKCVIKSSRKVLAVGLGDSKTEAKTSASQQVLRQLRKHCYTIQAKESYFKEGKATPYDFNPDPTKEHVYKLMKRNKFKDRSAMINFVQDFAKQSCPEEVIFGDDFTYDEREHILDFCRKIELNYRLMKCHSMVKYMHTHIAIFHQQPLPVIKAELIKAGGENDMYRLIQPGGKITNQTNQADLWPDTLEIAKENASAKPIPSLINRLPVDGAQSLRNERVQPVKTFDFENPSVKEIPVKITGVGVHNQITNNLKVDLPLQSMSTGPQPQYGSLKDIPFGPQPLFIPVSPVHSQPFMDVPLQFGPQPQNRFGSQQPANIVTEMQPVKPKFGIVKQPVSVDAQNLVDTSQVTGNEIIVPSVTVIVPNSPKKGDLREELDKKRQAEHLRKESPERKVHDMTTEERTDGSDGWSRKVFVAEAGDAMRKEELRSDLASKTVTGLQEKPQDLREKLRKKDLTRDKKVSQPKPKRNSPLRNHRRDQQRNSLGRNNRKFSNSADRRRRSPDFNPQRVSPERSYGREIWNTRGWSPEGRIVRHRDTSHERRVFHDPSMREDYNRSRNEGFRTRSRSPRLSPSRIVRSPGPVLRYRDLWDNIPPRLSETIFMYKYVKQDSTTENDPYALLRATRSHSLNIDFDFIKDQTAIDEWYVSVELITDDSSIHPLVGEGLASTEREASFRAACHAVDTIQKACRVIEPNYGYFYEGGVPDFIARKSPMKTRVYEIIQNMDPGTPLAAYTIEMMFNMFLSSDLEDLFFLATDFSYIERSLVIEMANKMKLWWRLFGPRHPSARPDDIVSTQHVCIFKQKSALQLVRELLENGRSTEKYSLVDPREYRLTRPRHERDLQ